MLMAVRMFVTTDNNTDNSDGTSIGISQDNSNDSNAVDDHRCYEHRKTTNEKKKMHVFTVVKRLTEQFTRTFMRTSTAEQKQIPKYKLHRQKRGCAAVEDRLLCNGPRSSLADSS